MYGSTSDLILHPNASHSLSGEAPEGVRGPFGGGRDPLVGSAGPEPAVDVDGLEVLCVASLALEVALAARCVDGAHVICKGREHELVSKMINNLSTIQIKTIFSR